MHIEKGDESTLLTRFVGSESILLCQWLEAENIPFQKLDEQMSSLYGGSIIIGGARIMVPTKALDRIIAFIDEIHEKPNES